MSIKKGFKDPFDEFPVKKKLLKQSTDVSEVAAERNVLSEGSYIFKRLINRSKYIPITNVRQRLPHEKKDFSGSFVSDFEYWQEPLPGYNTAYPNNHVFETKSGHIQEFDDTPDAERINTQHRSGTYEEISAKGSRTVKVVGDNYEIVARNNLVYVKGKSSLTVDGSMHILVLNDAHVEVNGNMTSVVRGNRKEYVSGNYEMEVIGNYKTIVHGNEHHDCYRFYNLQSNDGMNVSTAETMRIGSGDLLNPQQIQYYKSLKERPETERVPRMDVFSSGGVFIDSGGDLVHLQCELTTPEEFDNLRLSAQFPPAPLLSGLPVPFSLLESSNIIHYINRILRMDAAQRQIIYGPDNTLDRDTALEYMGTSSLRPVFEKVFDESDVKFVAAPLPTDITEFNKLNKGDENAVSIFPVMNGIPVMDVTIIKFLRDKIVEAAESLGLTIDWGGDWKGIRFFDVFQEKRTNTFDGENLQPPSIPFFGETLFADDDTFNQGPTEPANTGGGLNPYTNPYTPGIG